MSLYTYDSYNFENILLIFTRDGSGGGGGGGICTTFDSGCLSGSNVSSIKAPYLEYLR
jgi:hypothetical protein